MKAATIALTAILLAGAAAQSAPRQAYCYATVQASGGKLSRFLGRECAIYITPVFQTDASEDLLSAEFNQAVPEAGLSTCVTNDEEPDLPKAWQQFIDNGKADSCTVTMEPPPG